MAFRYDSFGSLASPELTKEGYLRAWATIARTGSQAYQYGDGSKCVEYRPPEEVGKVDSLMSFGGKCLTLEHPPELLTADNTSKYQVGFTDSEILFDGSYVKVRVTVTDQSSIDSIMRGDTLEVSAGYEVDLELTSGNAPDGTRFDAIQRNIRGNHVALTRKGRAGETVRLHLDSADVAFSAPSDQSTNPPMAKITLDNVEYEVEAGLASALTTHLQRQEQASSEKLDSVQSKCAELQGKLDSASGVQDELKTQIQSLTTKIDELKADSSEEPDIDQLVSDRIALIEKAKQVLDSSFDFTGKSSRSIHEAVITAVHGDSVQITEKSDDYVGARFDALIDAVSQVDSSIPLQRAVAESMRTDSSTSSSKKEARKKYMEEMQDAWSSKKPTRR
jgi:hypothetical protein